MKKTSKAFSITLILAIMLLACLLFNSLGNTGAWFTTTGHQIKIEFNINYQFYVYQTAEKNGNGIATKLNAASTDAPTYITLSGPIKEDEEIPVYLQLRSDEAGQCYLRFKFNVYALGYPNDTLINTTNTTTEKTALVDGFEKEDDGYYYFKGSDGALKHFGNGNIMLINGFQIESSELTSLDGGETLKITLDVECSDVAWVIS